jgi:hypothetical protein
MSSDVLNSLKQTEKQLNIEILFVYLRCINSIFFTIKK